MRKAESISPPFLHQRHLMWLFIPEAWATCRRPGDIIDAAVTMDSKCHDAETSLYPLLSPPLPLSSTPSSYLPFTEASKVWHIKGRWQRMK